MAKTARSGWDRLAAIRATFDAFGVVRSKNQRQMHECMNQAIAQQIWRDGEFEAQLDRIMRHFGVSTLREDLMMIAPRREGKSMAVAMAAANYAMNVETLSQAIFSTGRRASRKLHELIFRFLSRLPGAKARIAVHNIETMELVFGDADRREINSYPSKVQVTGGIF